MEKTRQLFVFFVFVMMASAVTYAASDWSSWLYEITTGKAASDTLTPVLSVIHAPVAPVTGGTITFTAADNPIGSLFGVAIYLDNNVLPTNYVCDDFSCRYIATFQGITAGYHTYYAKGIFGTQIIYSPTVSFTVTGTPTLTVSHSPQSPVSGGSVTIKAMPNLLGGAIFLDGSPLVTTEYCDIGGCGFVATKTGITSGQHEYYATAPFGTQTITSEVKTFTTSQNTPPVIDSFTTYPIVSIPPGTSSTLTWQTTGATGASINQGIGSVPTSGSVVVYPTAASTTYTLTAFNEVGEVSKSVTVYIVQGLPVINSFTATPASISQGQSAKLSWIISNATIATISGIGSINPSQGSVTVTPTQTTTYKLTADNEVGPVVSSVTVFVADTGPGPGKFITVSRSPEHPSTGDIITFTAKTSEASDLPVTDVTIFVDAYPLKTQQVCLSASGTPSLTTRDTCVYTAKTSLSAGTHAYYATGYAGGKLVYSSRAVVEVSKASVFSVGHSPESPASRETIKFTARSKEPLVGVYLTITNTAYDKAEPITLRMASSCGPVLSSAQLYDRCTYTATTQLDTGTYVYYATGSTDPGETERPTIQMQTERQKLVVGVADTKSILVSYSPKEPGPDSKITFTAKMGPALSANSLARLTDVVLTIGDHAIKMQEVCITSDAGVIDRKPSTTNDNSDCSSEGGFCGGIASFQCCDGLDCKLDGTYPDAGGKCVKEATANVCTWTATTSLAVGSYRYKVAGNYGGQQVSSETGSITVSSVERPKFRMYFSPEEPLSNEDILFTVQPSTDAMKNVQIYVDDVLVKTEQVCIYTFAQTPYPTCHYRAIKALPAGRHSFYATADYGDLTVRSDLVKFAVVDPSSSKFLHVYHSPEHPVSGDTTTFSAASRLDLDNVIMYVGGVAYKTQKVCVSEQDREAAVAKADVDEYDNNTDITDRLRPDCRYIASAKLRPGRYAYYAVGYYGQRMLRSDTSWVSVRSQDVPKFDVTNTPEVPNIAERITFDAYSPDTSMDNVIIYLDGKAMKTETTCTRAGIIDRSVEGGCHYTAVSEPLNSGLHTYYARGQYNNRVIITTTKKFFVVAREAGMIRVGHSPYLPSVYTTVTFFGRTKVRLTDMALYLDGEPMKMELTCAKLAETGSYKCAYIAKVPALRPGEHKYYAVGSGANGVKYSSGARTLTVSEEINPQNLPNLDNKEVAYDIAEIRSYSDLIDGVNTDATLGSDYAVNDAVLWPDAWTNEDWAALKASVGDTQNSCLHGCDLHNIFRIFDSQ